MWALLARGQCGLSGAQVAHGPPFASGYNVSCMYYDHIVHVKHACFDCCPYWAAMRHLIVCYKTHIFICVKCSFCISRYIQMHVEQSYCECLTVLICILLWMVSSGVLNLRLQVNAHVSWYGADSYVLFLFSFSWELGNVLLSNNMVRGWRNSGISTNEDFSHIWLRTLGFTPPVLGGDLWGHFRLPDGPA